MRREAGDDAVLHLPWRPDLVDGLRAETLVLPEYDAPYQALRAAPDAPLLALLAEHPLIRVAVPADLRQRSPLFRDIQTQVTRSFHSQPPHRDHPHRVGDPRRYNLFWAESARRNASTYFLPDATAPEVARWLAEALRGQPDAWEAAAPRIAAYRDDPRMLSRYHVPAAAVGALEALLRDGDPGPWEGLDPLDQLTTLTRALGNTPLVTALLDRLFADLADTCPGALTQEDWSEPCMVLADDTRLLHGRYGTAESGLGFYRIWICPPDQTG